MNSSSRHTTTVDDSDDRRSTQNNNINKKKNLKKLSHTLSWVLRHKAPELGLTMSPDGYVSVQELLSHPHPRLQGWTEEDVREVVATNDKQRYKLEMRNINNTQEEEEGEGEVVLLSLCIRANQGHSIPHIDTELLLTRVPPETLASSTTTIVHGTFWEAWKKHIQTQGLSRMSRNHIHFATGLPNGKNNDNNKAVISGMRKSCDVYIFINGAKCAEDGVDFFQSDNGVFLTSGWNNSGMLPVRYFSYVTDSSGKMLLDQRNHS